MTPSERSASARFRTILDRVLFCVLLGVLASTVATAVRSSNARVELQIVEREAIELYEAFDRYRVRNGAFPPSVGQPRLDRETLEPLRKLGYYDGVLTGKLLAQRIDGYDAPDDRGPDKEFWIELTPSADIDTRFIIARSDDAPSGEGRWLDGVYRLRDGKVRLIR